MKKEHLYCYEMPSDMTTEGHSALDCSACHERLSVPKLLPCAHLVCRQCLISRLEEGGEQTSCPSCQAPILGGDGGKKSGRNALTAEGGGIEARVDDLLTDLATAALVEAEQTLKGDNHACSCSQEASVFCLQCVVKFCDSCAECHSRIPATSEHVTHKLSGLTPEQLATDQPVPCAEHGDRQGELFCHRHQRLVCTLCASSTHRHCPQVTGMTDMAIQGREEVKCLLLKMADRETTVTAQVNKQSTQITDLQAEFRAMRAQVNAAMDEVQARVEARRTKLLGDVQSLEDQVLAQSNTHQVQLEQLRASLTSNKSMGHRLATWPQDGHLLAMLVKLKAHLKTVLARQLPPALPKTRPGSLLVQAGSVERAKKAVSAIGELGEGSQLQETKFNHKRRPSSSATTISGRRGRGKSQPGHADRPRSAGSQRVPGLRLQTRVQPQPHECASSGVRRGNPTLQHTSTSAVRTCRKQESAEDLLAPLEIDDAEGGSDKQQVPVNSTVNSSEESPEIPSVSVLGLEASEDQADLAHNSSGELRDHPHTQESQPEDKCRTAEGKVYRHVIMKPGARVRRGPDWCHGNEDGSGEGIVVEFPVFYHPSVAKVWWNDGNTHIYRYGCDGKYDIKVITDDDDDDGEQHFL